VCWVKKKFEVSNKVFEYFYPIVFFIEKLGHVFIAGSVENNVSIF
jgi:hypothetical protein